MSGESYRSETAETEGSMRVGRGNGRYLRTKPVTDGVQVLRLEGELILRI